MKDPALKLVIACIICLAILAIAALLIEHFVQ